MPALRGQRRRLLLQGLACRAGAGELAAAAEGQPRHRRHPLAVRPHDQARHGARHPHRLRGRDGPAQPGGRDHAGVVLVRELAAGGADRVEPGDRCRGRLDDADGPRRRRHRQLRAVPLHPGLLAQLHGDRHPGSAGELRRHPRWRDPDLEPAPHLVAGGRHRDPDRGRGRRARAGRLPHHGRVPPARRHRGTDRGLPDRRPRGRRRRRPRRRLPPRRQHTPRHPQLDPALVAHFRG